MRRHHRYFAEREQTIVVYTTSLQAIRKTRDDCTQMLKLFDLLALKVKVKDVHLEPTFGKELAERVEHYDAAHVADVLPQCFINVRVRCVCVCALCLCCVCVVCVVSVVFVLCMCFVLCVLWCVLCVCVVCMRCVRALCVCALCVCCVCVVCVRCLCACVQWRVCCCASPCRPHPLSTPSATLVAAWIVLLSRTVLSRTIPACICPQKACVQPRNYPQGSRAYQVAPES